MLYKFLKVIKVSIILMFFHGCYIDSDLNYLDISESSFLFSIHPPSYNLEPGIYINYKLNNKGNWRRYENFDLIIANGNKKAVPFYLAKYGTFSEQFDYNFKQGQKINNWFTSKKPKPIYDFRLLYKSLTPELFLVQTNIKVVKQISTFNFETLNKKTLFSFVKRIDNKSFFLIIPNFSNNFKKTYNNYLEEECKRHDILFKKNNVENINFRYMDVDFISPNEAKNLDTNFLKMKSKSNEYHTCILNAVADIIINKPETSHIIYYQKESEVIPKWVVEFGEQAIRIGISIAEKRFRK